MLNREIIGKNSASERNVSLLTDCRTQPIFYKDSISALYLQMAFQSRIASFIDG